MGNMRHTNSLGISPLLATVLLIAATVVTTTMLSGWVSTTMSTTQTTVTNRTSESIACTAAEIVIDDVYVTTGATSETASVILRNSGGTDDLTITSAQLYNKNGDNITASNAPVSDFDKGEIATLSFSFKPAGDSSKYGNNGTLMNGPLLATGRYGSGIRLDGINDFVNLTSRLGLPTASDSGTWEFWLNLHNISGAIFSTATALTDGGNREFRIRIVSSTSYAYGVGWGNEYTVSVDNMNNTWSYIVVTKTSGGVWYGYFNGIQRSNVTDTQTWQMNGADFGRFTGGASYTFLNGTIDDVAIWNRSLTNAEINTSMNVAPTAVSNTNDLVGYWNFDNSIITCPSDFSRVVVTTNCGGVSAEFTKPPKC